MAAHSILLKNGTVLQHDADDHVHALRNTDVLIEGDKIAKVSKNITATHVTQTIDCTDKIISPGFIDTHHHMWQTQLKSRHEDMTLFEYFYTGNWQCYSYEPSDIYWGQLSACLESIDAGTTTVVDHAHSQYSPQHATVAIAATATSGLRCFYCYTPTLHLKSWTSAGIESDPEMLPEWFLQQLEDLAEAQPWGEGRVYLGFGFDFYFLPKEVVVSAFERARALGVKLITSHYVVSPAFGKLSVVQTLDDYGLLKNDMLISHSSRASVKDGEILTRAGVYTAVTPETESQMACGTPATLRGEFPVSLGVDCHTTSPCDIMSQARLGLQLARNNYNEKYLDEDKFPLTTVGTSERAFNLGTIEGARAVRMEDQIGSLVEGKLADIVIFDATSPSMNCAAQRDPLAAVVRHSSIRDIETVIVNGIIRKQNGRLLPIKLDAEAPMGANQEVKWSMIARETAKSSEKVNAKVDGLDMKIGAEALAKLFYVSTANLVP